MQPAAYQSLRGRLFCPHSMLVPLAKLYGCGVALRNYSYDHALLKTVQPSLPVICIGNATAGGSGKSPFVQYAAAELLKRGRKPVIVARGYGGKERGPRLVTDGDSPADVGDEPLMHHRLLSGRGPVVVARDRVLGVELAAANNLGEIVLLDDGFQHRRLGRDFNVLLLDASSKEARQKWENGMLLPAGVLREPIDKAIARADCLVLVARSLTADSPDAEPLRLERLRSAPPLFRVNIAPSHLEDAANGERFELDYLQGRTVSAAAGVASPEAFFQMLEQLGADIGERWSYPDHYDFSAADQERWQRSGRPVIVTAKDAVKLRRDPASKGALLVLMIKAVFGEPEGEQAFWRLALQKTAR